ncbi:CGNR zinc finger domain-containing protein [Streptomyces sp. NPDC052225]|uniref:CGNR zinc finger domain-containing protein n=1 Tax=Streptomyces sp. NPDC052225 TaxID=3154949 RepID=UPI00343DD2BE
MRDISTGPDGTRLVLDLALTIRHDGSGGVADDLLAPLGLTAWVRAHADMLPVGEDFTADDAVLERVRAVRAAVRALFARAVRPAEPSPADVRRLLPVPEALARLNAAAALVPAVPVLDWADGDPAPAARDTAVVAAPDTDLLVTVLARAAIGFLTGDDRHRLRACHAPRCVRYFLKEHPRQEWCKPSCGNRARVARHHERHNSRTEKVT